MTTLQFLLGKCKEDADCLIWQGSLSKSSGHPKYNDKAARRLVYELAKGRIPAGHYVTVTCDCAACLSPEHLRLTTKAEITAKVHSCPTVKAKKVISCAKASRKTGKLTMEKAREIRASNQTCDDLALVYGVDRTLISRVRTNKAWRETTAAWHQGLGAR
jgi:hypothetical protein